MYAILKNKIKSCLITTSLSLLVLTIVASLYQGHFLCLSTIYEVFLANILIHLGLTALEHFESTYFLMEDFLTISYILFILILLGFIFNWYQSISIWMLMCIGVIVYILGSLIDTFRVHVSLNQINHQLKELHKTSHE